MLEASVGPSRANFKMPTIVVYDLVKLKEGWRIAEITWDGKDTLSGIFVKK